MKRIKNSNEILYLGILFKKRLGPCKLCSCYGKCYNKGNLMIMLFQQENNILLRILFSCKKTRYENFMGGKRAK